MAWAAELNSSLTYNIYASWAVDWGDNVWRLSSAGTNPKSGFNQTTSEMGDLYYNELRLTADVYNTPQVLNATNFDNLKSYLYWTSTGDKSKPFGLWGFWMYHGRLDAKSYYIQTYGLAIRNGQVSAVPIPGAIWLLGSGLLCLIGLRCKRKE